MADVLKLGGPLDTTVHFENDGTTFVHYSQDCEPVVDYAHAMRNYRFHADGALSDVWQPVAEVPFAVWMEWCKESGVDLASKEAEELLIRKINDPAFQALRTAPKLIDPHVIIKGDR